MAEKKDYVSVDLTTVDSVENVSSDEAQASQDITKKVFIGKAVCVVTNVDAKQEDLTYAKPPYSCYAVLPELTIDSVLEIEMPVHDNDGVIMKNGEPMMKVRKLTQDEQAKATAKFKGTILNDKILLEADLEAATKKKRRLNIAQAFGLIGPEGGALPAGRWYDIRNKKIVISTQRNVFTPKEGSEPITTAKVRFDGYSPFNVSVENQAGNDFSDL